MPNLTPLEIDGESGIQTWKHGKMETLVLASKNLTKIPESICDIYNDISVFDISNNTICPPYPACIENMGYQNREDCMPP